MAEFRDVVNADIQPSTSEPAIPGGRQAPKRKGGLRKIQHSGKCPSSAFRAKEKPTAKRTKLATKPSEDYQKEVDELGKLCGLLPEDEYNKKWDAINDKYGYNK